ncbi:hypothetical protein [Chryseobacterium sp. MDT2-18]|uniref:COG1470 family protein n=1 Tax=Chryseobacterium sp. MDT2-18 TaxID=1259136 RepID=UPI0027878B64|nr:hypothetical protein [Chryseobacterium sp. MDT2-18]MDQ0477958.1 hypothetical protein [Chryseobacterium sp. MDT2-18]
METFKKIFTFLFFLGTVFSFAQSDSIAIETDQSVVGFNETMLSLLVKLQNNTNSAQNLELTYTADKGIRILSSATAMKLAPKEKVFLPFKAFVGKTQPAGTSLIHFTLRNADSKELATAKTQLVIEPKRQLRIIANQPQVLIEKIGDSLQISTQVYNGGNQTETVEIFATFPQNFDGEVNLKKKIELKPFSNQEVVFSKIIDKELLKLELFTVNIAGTNSNKEYFGNTMVMVQNALGNRRYVDPFNSYQYLQRNTANHISWTTNNPFSEFSASQNVDLHSEINIGNTKASLNLNGTYWQRSDTPLQFQNTWVKLENRLFGAQLGNLYISDMDMNVNGRGAEFSYLGSAEKKVQITAGAVEKNYNLFDPFRLNYFPRGYSVFAKSSIRFNENGTTDHQLILDTDSFQRSFIIKNGYTYNNKKDTFYNFDFGYGYTASETDQQVAEPSAALGFNYRKNWKQYTLSSNNYYSTGFYPGIKKGNTVFEERLARSFEKFSLYGGYSLNIYNPKNINPLYQYSSFSSRNKIELGANFTIAKGLTANLSSQWVSEHSGLFTVNFAEIKPIDFQSAFIYTSVNYNTPDNRNRFNLTQSQGISYYLDFTKPQFIYQMQANWYHGNFMLSTNYQHGNFMLYEGNSNGTLTSDTEKISTMANYRLALVNKNLNLNLSAIGNYDSRYGKNISFTTSLDYRAFRATKIFANFNYNKYINNQLNNQNIYFQVGISQELPAFGEEATKFKSGSIKIFTFYDLNNNNSYEPAIDRPASSVKVKINNTIFVSDENGNIRYRKVPYNEYLIKSLENQWHADDQTVNVDQKEVLVTIPLEKTSMIKGKIEYQQTTKTQYEVPQILTGIPVIFKNKLNKTFTFYTTSTGDYTAYLPLGSYQISISNTILPQNVYIDDNIQNATAEEGVVKTLENFVLKVKEKKVQVKKFGITD